MNRINNLLRIEPEWVDLDEIELSRIPGSVQDWLTESGSLTLRMKQQFDGVFEVSVAAEGWSLPFLLDAVVLRQDDKTDAFVREVILTIAGVPHVFARTTIPQKSLQDLQQLAKLGNKPLGEVIFNYPQLKRVRLDVVELERYQLSSEMANLIEDETSIWARRNTYDIDGHQFVVSEFFLPIMF